MKLAIIAAAMLLSFSAHAQDIASTATNTATTQATSAAQNAGNSQAITFTSPSDSSTTLRAAPSIGGVGGYAGFSPENCGNAQGGGVSIVGFAATYQGPNLNQPCDTRLTVRSLGQAAATVTNEADRAGILRAMMGKACLIDQETFEMMVEQGLCPAAAIRLARAKFQPDNARRQEPQYAP